MASAKWFASTPCVKDGFIPSVLSRLRRRLQSTRQNAVEPSTLGGAPAEPSKGVCDVRINEVRIKGEQAVTRRNKVEPSKRVRELRILEKTFSTAC
jgi:hypothetical protein